MTKLPKYTPSILMENCDYIICSFLSVLFLYDPFHMVWRFEKFIFEQEDSYSFKITCILVKFPVSAEMKMASTSAAAVYNSTSLANSHKRVKGSHRRAFILVLDWIFKLQLCL